jgi:hypothetical protein
VVGRSSGRTRVGDSLGATTGMGFVALAGRITSRWTAGAYVVEPVVTRIDLAPLPLPDGTRDQGSLDGTVRDLGLATAFEVAEHFHVGARLSAVRLSLAGDYRRQPEIGPPRLEVATRGRETRVATSFGLLYEPTPAVRIGLVTLGGATWRLERTATSPSLETTLDPGSAYDVRQPGVVSGGLSLRLSPRLTVIGQLDYVRYGEILAVTSAYPGGYARVQYDVFAWEPRAGVEVSLPRPTFSVQIRAGVHGVALAGAGAATSPAGPASAPLPVFPTSLDPMRLAAVQEIAAPRAPPPLAATERALRFAVGASLVTTRGVRLDLAGRFGGERAAFVAGGAFRF